MNSILLFDLGDTRAETIKSLAAVREKLAKLQRRMERMWDACERLEGLDGADGRRAIIWRHFEELEIPERELLDEVERLERQYQALMVKKVS